LYKLKEGGGRELTDLLMNITMLAKSGAFINLIDLLMMTGLFFAFILAAFSGRIFSTPIRNFVIMMIVVYGLLKPTSDVMIIDERTNQNYNVSNVPLGVALFGNFQSSLSRDLVNFFENTLNNGNYYASYAKYGFGFGPFSTKAIVEYMNSPAIGNGNPEYGRLMTNLSKFSQECFGYSAAQGNNNKALMAIKAMPASNDAFKIFLGQDQNYPYINGGLTMDYVNSDNSITSEDCKSAGAQIYSDILNFINSSQVDQNFVNQVQGMLSANPTSLASDLQTAMQYHFNSLSQLDNLKMNILFSSMSYDFVKLGASGLSNNADVSNYAVNSVLGSAKMSAIQQAVENFGQGAVAVALAPKMLNFTKMMYYLLFFVLLTLALTPLARAIGKVTLVFFVFLTILEPLYVLLNYLLNTMAYYQAASSGTCNNSPAGILSCLDINSLFYTNVLNFSILGLIGLAYMLASAMVTGSGAVIGAIGDKFGSGAITYQGANNNIGSLSNFMNDPMKVLAAQNTSASSFISDGGAGFQSSLANLMSTQMGMRATELGASLATYDGTRGTVTKDGYTTIDGVKYSNVAVDRNGHVSGFKTAEGTFDQLIKGLNNSGDASLAKLAGSLQFLRNHIGNGGISATITKGKDGYTIEFDMGQAGTAGKQSILLDKDGNFTQGVIDTGKGSKIMIENGRVKIGEQDLTTDLQRIQQTYEKNKLASIGETFAKSLGWNLKKEDAIKLGQIVSNARSTQDLREALKEFARLKATEIANSFRHTNKDSTTKEESSSEKSSISAGPEVGIGPKGPSIGLFGIKFSADEIKTIKHGNVDEIAKIVEAKMLQSVSEKDSQISKQVDSSSKTSQTVSEKGTTTSDALTKAFTKAKEEAQRLTFSDKESATYAQELAQKYGLELTPQALEKLIAAVQSGDTRQIMAVLGDIASKSELRAGKDAQDLLNEKKEVEKSGEELKKEVEKKTYPVEQQMKNDEQELKKDEGKVEGKLEDADKGLKNVNVGRIPQPTPPSKEMPENPKKPEVKQPPQQPRTQKEQPPIDPKKLDKYLDKDDRPIQGQPTVQEIINRLNPSSQKPSNLFTPIDKQVKAGGIPEAPSAKEVNRSGNNGGGGDKNTTGDQRFRSSRNQGG
jgi:hypothetical protein